MQDDPSWNGNGQILANKIKRFLRSTDQIESNQQLQSETVFQNPLEFDLNYQIVLQGIKRSVISLHV